MESGITVMSLLEALSLTEAPPTPTLHHPAPHPPTHPHPILCIERATFGEYNRYLGRVYRWLIARLQ